MKQKTIATRHLRTKIAAGYVLILFVIFGIVYIWLNEQHRRQELEITSQKIRCLRKDIHEVYVKMVDLSLIGETVLDWNEEDMNIYTIRSVWRWTVCSACSSPEPAAANV